MMIDDKKNINVASVASGVSVVDVTNLMKVMVVSLDTSVNPNWGFSFGGVCFV